ncbi:excitatory amino acid transporter 1-like [Ornithodoros turicata]|uniref:excitatory amino acid transporter 1-like n=1 Tax=Ornithodoros turicata TaxID=34597 RepID=UPI00313A0687
MSSKYSDSPDVKSDQALSGKDASPADDVSQSSCWMCVSFRNWTWESILATAATCLGLAIGYWVRLKRPETDLWTDRQIMYINFPGELLLRMLTMLFVPLKVSCIVGAVGSTSYKVSARLMRWAFLYIVATAALSALVGFAVAMIVQPGFFRTPSNYTGLTPTLNYSAVFTANLLLQMVRDMFPPNIVQTAVATWSSVRELSHVDDIQESDSGESRAKIDEVSSNGLGLMAFSLALGFVLAHAADDRNVMVNFFISLSNILISVWRIFLWYLPIGFFFLSAGDAILHRPLGELPGVSGCAATVVLALLLHMFVVLPLLYRTFIKKGSPIASLPVTIWSMEHRAGLDPRVARFVAAIGVNINTNGMTIFLAVSIVFLLQYYNISITVYDFLYIGLGTVVASIAESDATRVSTGPASISDYIAGASSQDKAVLYTTLSLVQRLCAVTNVIGDCVGAAICQEIIMEDLLDEATEGS